MAPFHPLWLYWVPWVCCKLQWRPEKCFVLSVPSFLHAICLLTWHVYMLSIVSTPPLMPYWGSTHSYTKLNNNPLRNCRINYSLWWPFKTCHLPRCRILEPCSQQVRAFDFPPARFYWHLWTSSQPRHPELVLCTGHKPLCIYWS